MTTREAILIEKCRQEGMGAKRIASEVGVSLNTIKSYLRRHPMGVVCRHCGKGITQPVKAREKKFCSDKCRLAWWHEHQRELNRSTTEKLCAFCGMSFTTHKKDQRFCSRTCYSASRRKEVASNVT